VTSPEARVRQFILAMSAYEREAYRLDPDPPDAENDEELEDEEYDDLVRRSEEHSRVLTARVREIFADHCAEPLGKHGRGLQYSYPPQYLEAERIEGCSFATPTQVEVRTRLDESAVAPEDYDEIRPKEKSYTLVLCAGEWRIRSVRRFHEGKARAATL